MARPKYPSDKQDQFMVRLPAGMRDRIAAAAKANKRSMNAEIVASLEDAYPDPSIYREELNFIDELEAIQYRLDRMRAARLAEVSESLSEEFAKEQAEKRRTMRRHPPRQPEDD